MRKPEYWDFIRQIWHDPHKSNLRRIFADWLDEHGMIKASRKQRQFAKWTDQAYVIWRTSYNHIYMLIKIKGEPRLFRIKKNGVIVQQPKALKLFTNTDRFMFRMGVRRYFYRGRLA